MANTDIDISTIIPEAKDHGRAAKLAFREGQWFSTPFIGAASKMAQAIDDPYKLVRRAKAVGQRYGFDTPVSRQFTSRMRELGFTAEQRKQIAS